MKKNPATLQKVAPATLGSLLAAGSAQGMIVYLDAANAISLSQSDGATSVDWNIDQAGRVEARLVGVTSYNGIFLDSVFSGTHNFGAFQAGFLNMPNLATGYVMSTGVIDTNSGPFFGEGYVISYSNFQIAKGFTSGEAGYIGFKFGTLASPIFGWASITLTTGANYSMTINEWAYETTGAGIQVGDKGVVPEPETTAAGLAGLALGAAGLRRLRKRKAASN